MKKGKRIKQLESEVMDIYARLARCEELLEIQVIQHPPTPIQGINTSTEGA